MRASSPSQVYYVRSDTDVDLFYLVAAVDDRCACGQKSYGLWHCSCPDHRYRARDCKHIRRVVEGQVAPARVKVAA